MVNFGTLILFFKDLTRTENEYYLLWQIISASLRCKVNWGKAIFLKDSDDESSILYLEFIKNLYQRDAYFIKSISDFPKKVSTKNLLYIDKFIGEDNSFFDNVKDSEIFNSFVNQSIYGLDIRYENLINFAFKGFIIQKLNSFSHSKNIDPAVYDNCLFLNISNSSYKEDFFYIREYCLNNKEVLEYILYRALTDNTIFNCDLYRFNEVISNKGILNINIDCDDLVRVFWSEFSNKFSWQFLPSQFIYDLYKAWVEKDYISKRAFISHSKKFYDTGCIDWCYDENKKSLGKFCNIYEPLVEKYGLDSTWNKDFLVSYRLRGFIKK